RLFLQRVLGDSGKLDHLGATPVWNSRPWPWTRSGLSANFCRAGYSSRSRGVSNDLSTFLEFRCNPPKLRLSKYPWRGNVRCAWFFFCSWPWRPICKQATRSLEHLPTLPLLTQTRLNIRPSFID